MAAPRRPSTILTVGHSTRPLAAFIDLVRAHGVTTVADVRTIPRSRTNPQFDRAGLPRALATAGIGYAHLPGLGGLRHPRPDSPNTGWRTPGFRGFADYMQTPAFAEHLDALIARARDERIALMCAEALPWRCHRSLLADALTVNGLDVAHIMSRTRASAHCLTPFARIDGTRVTYPKHSEGAGI
jgi:uncharacterized protein (DUF488 family)